MAAVVIKKIAQSEKAPHKSARRRFNLLFAVNTLGEKGAH